MDLLRPRTVTVVVVLVLALGWGVWMLARPDRNTTAVPVATPSPSTPAPAPSSATPSVEVEAEDEDAEIDQVDPQVAVVAEEFVAAWLTVDPAVRARRLDSVTTPGLAGPLKATMPGKVWRTEPAGEPEVLRGSQWAAHMRQGFANGRAIVMVLEYRPEAKHQWLVASIAEAEPAESSVSPSPGEGADSDATPHDS